MLEMFLQALVHDGEQCVLVVLDLKCNFVCTFTALTCSNNERRCCPPACIRSVAVFNIDVAAGADADDVVDDDDD